MIPEEIKYFFNENQIKSEVLEGNIWRGIYTGVNIQVIIYHFPPNTTFPLHVHDKHEQMGYLVSGKMGFNVKARKNQVARRAHRMSKHCAPLQLARGKNRRGAGF